MKKTELKVWITKDALQKNKLNHGDMYDYSNISLLVLDDKLGRVVKSIQGREVVKATLIVEEELTELEKLKKENEELIFFVREINRISTEYPDFFSMGDNLHSCVNEYSKLIKRVENDL